MNSHTAIMTIESPRLRKATWRHLLLVVCFFTATTVAMLGWLTGIGWAGVALVRWLAG
jgi:hypothetical protein